jgi:alpha-beta hydrolase superfamily lysophospholipase
MGGLVASCLVAEGNVPIQGLILSSPVLDPGLSVVQKLMLATLPRIAPNLTVGNGLDPDFISHDPDVVAAYNADPRVHNRISGRLARFIADSGPMVLEHAPHWTVPTLLMWAGQDKLVNPRGARAFAAAAPPEVVTARCFDGLFHEIFNELESEPVFATLKQWLDERF